MTTMSNKPQLTLLLQLLFGLCLACALFYPNFSAQWGLTDDHEIIRYVGDDHVLRFSEIPNMLMKTEAGNPWGSKPRYRPVYYSLRLCETALWGDHVFLWYLFRVVVLGVS